MPSIQDFDLRLRHRPRIVVIDSEPNSARQTVATLTSAGYDCQSFVESEAALATLFDGGAEVVVVEFSSERSASDVVRRIKMQAPETAVVLMTPSPTVPAAVAAMRQGAFDYLTKPINTEELTAVVGKAIEMASLRRENRLLHEQLDVASMAAAFIAESSSSRNLAAMVRRAAPANSPVLIQGESGTGKELIARMLHHWSSRAQGPFIKLSFKLLAPAEASAALADRVRIGAMLSEYVERSLGGTLFLDEISEAGPEYQSALLGLIGDGGHRGYGANQGRGSRPLGVRIVAATNRVLTHEVAGGRIRPDLYFALNVIAIEVAPLRERREDIMPLARHFLALHAAESGRSLILTADAEKTLLSYSWPGNVRELENVIERAVVMTSSERISAEALMIRTDQAAATPALAVHAESVPAADEPAASTTADDTEVTTAVESEGAEAPVSVDGTLQEFLDRAAALRIKRAIEFAKGNRNAAAAALGIDRTTLYRLMRRLGV